MSMRICLTGASRGIGRALSSLLARNGHEVWGVARDTEALGALERELAPACFRWSQMDLGDPASIQTWERETIAGNFFPDALILNASLLLNDMEQGLDAEKAAQVIRANLEGNLRCIAAFLPGFLERKRGTILGICSTSALRPSPRSASYAASKAGLALALRSLQLRHNQTSITFKIAYLGPVATGMWEGKSSSFLIPSPEQTARALARFLASRRDRLYYPFVSTTLLRLSSLLPDAVFARASRFLLR